MSQWSVDRAYLGQKRWKNQKEKQNKDQLIGLAAF